MMTRSDEDQAWVDSGCPASTWGAKPTKGRIFHYWRSRPGDIAYRILEVRGHQVYGAVPSRAVSVLYLGGEWQPVPEPK